MTTVPSFTWTHLTSLPLALPHLCSSRLPFCFLLSLSLRCSLLPSPPLHCPPLNVSHLISLNMIFQLHDTCWSYNRSTLRVSSWCDVPHEATCHKYKSKLQVYYVKLLIILVQSTTYWIKTVSCVLHCVLCLFDNWKVNIASNYEFLFVFSLTEHLLCDDFGKQWKGNFIWLFNLNLHHIM